MCPQCPPRWMHPLWRSRQKSAPFFLDLPLAQQHRVCGVFSAIVLWGPSTVRLPAFPDAPVVSVVFRAAIALQGPCMVFGDFKWRPAHAGLACVFGSTISPPVPCVQGSLTACPTRAFGFCNVDLQQVCVFSKFLPGIPHHHAVTVSTLWPTPAAADANPLRALCYLRLGL